MADMIDYQKLLEMWRDEKQRRQMAEGELSIVKGIGNNSPEMKVLKAENEKLKKRVHDAEGETSIVKAIGTNSPEMKALKERIKELDNSLAVALEINESHQRYNGKLQTRVTELEEDNKKLSRQIEDKIDLLRKTGGL